MKDSSLVYTVEEAGAMLGVSRNTAYEAARNGDIPVIRIGRRIVVPKHAFDQMMAEKVREAVEPPVIKRVKMERKVNLTSRVSIDLNNKLVDAATARGVSLAQEVADRLAASFDKGE